MGFLDQPLVVELIQEENRRKLEAKSNKYLKKTKVRRGKKPKGKKKKLKIPKMSYAVYIKSSYWKTRKLQYYSTLEGVAVFP